MATNPSGVRGDGGGREAYGVAENPGGERHGVGGGVKSLQGIITPGVDVLSWRDKTPGVATTSKGVPEEGGRGRGGEIKPPTTRATEARGTRGSNGERMGGPRTAVAPIIGEQQRTPTERGIRLSLSTARYRAMSTAYRRHQGRRSIQPTWGTRRLGMAKGAQERRPTRP